MALGAWLRPRVRLLATAGAVGFVVGALALFALATVRTPEFASTQIFAVGALVLGFAVLGWSGSVLAGNAVETLQSHLDTDTGWTERDSRRAMARLTGFGAGVMVGVSVATALLP
ncbi:DUF7268 family protein [Halococcus saccharolyticus]|uniref:Uncharacterized protein n=1 Tax=Halococcus saccharolyticus DSM 5350 TaxID=1227455 RepID=M0MEZ5_9EURY|nr:hypothetical protein [Halococcus saccharolyticus]EMA43254.1 hypothetical protein C449_14787 [Halococcus saccharolyticus DSM 5350]